MCIVCVLFQLKRIAKIPVHIFIHNLGLIATSDNKYASNCFSNRIYLLLQLSIARSTFLLSQYYSQTHLVYNEFCHHIIFSVFNINTKWIRKGTLFCLSQQACYLELLIFCKLWYCKQIDGQLNKILSHLYIDPRYLTNATAWLKNGLSSFVKTGT